MKSKIIIIFIIFLSLFLRIYKLGQFPVGFLWDEPALGYNAYSILKTAKDEYGKTLPIIFKSFGDFKPGLYIYLTVPSIALFGLNEFSVRLPSAIFGTLTIVCFYLLLKELNKMKILSEEGKDNNLPIIVTILLAINPWHFNFSRGAWELNVMLFEIILGFFLLIKFFNNQKKIYVISSSLAFFATFFTYQAAKLLTPLLLFSFVFFFRNKIKSLANKWKIIFVGIILFGFITLNLITFIGKMGGRLKVMSIFSYPRSEQETNLFLSEDNQKRLPWIIFHSSPVFFLRSIAGRYLNYFSPAFLFFKGDWSNTRNGIVYQGVFYSFDLIFILLGIYSIFSRKKTEWENFMLFWLIIAPIPAALTRDSISSIRSFSLVIPMIFIISVGINYFFHQIKNFSKPLKFSLYAIFIFIYGFFFVRLLDLYLIHDPKINSADHLYGYKEAVRNLNLLKEGKNKIVFTNVYGQPYIFYLFYSQYDPKKYQAQAKLRENPYGDVGEVEKIDNFEFRKIFWPADRELKNSLFVGNEFDLPLQDITGQKGITFLKEIKFLNGKTAFRIAETK